MFGTYGKAVLGVILVFILGCIAGWLGASVVHYRQTTLMLQRGPEATAELLENRMTRNLDLDAAQQQQIHTDFMENLRQRKLLQTQIQPQVQLLNRATMQQIMAILRPDQAEHFRQNVSQFRQRFGKGPFNPNAESPSPAVAQPEVGATNSSVGTPPAP